MQTFYFLCVLGFVWMNAQNMNMDPTRRTPPLRILACPRFCTMRCAYARTIRGDGKWPSMAQLCEHFEVTLRCAHDARGDSEALANCVAEAWRRGVMLPDAQGSGEERGAA